MADRSPSGKNLVLVADDEGAIVRMATTILSGAGFRAVSGERRERGVWRSYRELQNEICLVLTDVVMPDGGGLEMAQKILELDPESKDPVHVRIFGRGARSAGAEAVPVHPETVPTRRSDAQNQGSSRRRRQTRRGRPRRLTCGPSEYNSSFEPGAALANSRNSGRAAIVRSKESFPNL